VLVTGGAGFIGSHATELLLREGAKVTVASRRASPPFLRPVLADVDLRIGDLDEPSFCREVVARQEIVLHLAGHVGGLDYNRSRHAELFTRNLGPFLNVLDAARAAGVDRLLVTSSACVYPRDCSNPIPEREGTHREPEPTNAGYGWAKRMQEYLGAAWMRETGVPVAIARPFNAYGPRDDFRPERSHVIPSLLRRALAGEDPFVVWGSGEQTRSFLYVKDFARGLLLIAERHPAGEALNLGGSEEVSIRTLVEHVLEATGRSPRVTFDTSRPEGQPRRSCDTARMRAVLAWEPETPLAQGLRETVAWMEAAGLEYGRA
jgi:GDP-L-fucose synthase